MNGEVLGVSVDDHKTQCDFASSLRVTFPMASDANKRLSKAFGVLWPIVGFNKRVTFVADKIGVIQGVFAHEFQILRHLDETIALLQRLEGQS